jgi:hypothetical protein
MMAGFDFNLRLSRPANKGLQLAHASNSYRARNDSHNAQRAHREEDVVGPPEAHAKKLLRHLLAKNSEQRGEVSEEIVGELVSATLSACA